MWFAAQYGMQADPWQGSVLDDWLGSSAGRWSAARCGLAVPRQNGKNGVLEIRELYGMVALAERFLHTAHEVKTARKAFLRLLEFFDNPRLYPDLAGMVREIRRTNGQEAIVLRNGGSVEFIARSKGSGRGFSVDVLVIDEAQELTEDQLAALRPTISASANPQIIQTGTPPLPGEVGGAFARVRALGVAGGDGRLAWQEFSCPDDLSLVDLDDRGEWAARNPAMGVRLLVETIADERADMTDEVFARERLGWWQPKDEMNPGVIDAAVWGAGLDQRVTIPGVPCLALEVSQDSAWACIGAAGTVGDLFPVEVLENRPGTGWVVSRLREIISRNGGEVAVQPTSPAGGLIADLEQAGVPVVKVGAQEYAQACLGFFQKVNEGLVRHLGQPELDVSVRNAVKKTVGDAWVFDRKRAGLDISPLAAVALAAHLAAKKLAPLDEVTIRFF